jgi:very-short-patch-repair endonuclease
LRVLQVKGRLDGGLAELAAAQCGVVHRRQLHALGIGRGAIAHRLSSGALHPVVPSVFAVGHPGLSQRGMLVAALLYSGDDTVLSHDSAAWVWGLKPAPASWAEVTVIRRHVRSVPAVSVHWTGGLDRSDVRLRDGLPVTAPARTLIDRAGQIDDGSAAALLAQARAEKLVTDRDLGVALDLHPLRAGVARLRRVLASQAGPQLTRSEAERRLGALLATAQLPAPEVNAQLHGFEVDFLWREQRLVVEFDGRQFHARPSAFERDRRRDQVLLAAGYRVLRVTWRQLVDEPVALVVRIGQALSAGALAAGTLVG